MLTCATRQHKKTIPRSQQELITKRTTDLAAAQRELKAPLAKHKVGTITPDDIARHGADILFAVNDDETGGFSNRKVGEVEGREATKRLTKKIELRALEYEAHAAGRVISAARREFGDVPTWSAVKSKELFHQNIRRFGQSPPLSSSANIPRGSHTSISESNRDRLCESHTR